MTGLTSEGRQRRDRGESGIRHSSRRPKVQREWVTKMVGLYREKQPSALG